MPLLHLRLVFPAVARRRVVKCLCACACALVMVVHWRYQPMFLRLGIATRGLLCVPSVFLTHYVEADVLWRGMQVWGMLYVTHAPLPESSAYADTGFPILRGYDLRAFLPR